MELYMVITLITKRWGTEKDYEIELKKPLNIDFIPRVNDSISDRIGEEIGETISNKKFITVQKVYIYPELTKCELFMSKIYTKAINYDELLIEVDKAKELGWDINGEE